ncbi:MAG TPA: HEAT repeat domain-containing protein [Polyangia bacterium]|nr:HEAT repeat domain-containing protein [Polyangia bacterium]
MAALLAADAGASAPSTRHDVEAALTKNPSPPELHRLAETAEPTLIAIAGDRAAAAPVRGRALAALAYARSGRAHTFLENFIIKTTPSRDPGDHVLLRRAAMALGWQSGPRLTEVLAPLLDSDDREVRLDAATALALGRAHDAERPLRARLEVETDPAVRHEIQAALTTIAK